MWRETCARTMMKVDMGPPPETPFRCTAQLRRLPNLAIASIATTPNRLTRSRSLVADGNDDLLFVVPLEGHVEIRQSGREADLAPGSGWLMSCENPSATTVKSFSRFVSLAIPAAVLSPMIGGIDANLMPAIPDRAEAIRLLMGYLACLDQDIALSAPSARHLVVSRARSGGAGGRRDARRH